MIPEISNEFVLKVNNLSKEFVISQPHKYFVNYLLGRKNRIKRITALDNISFELGKGEILGIIGANGSGKSTLLKIIANITKPTNGNLIIKKGLVEYLETSPMFIYDLSGRENIYLQGMLLGMSKKEITNKIYEIIKFSELGEFIDAPVRTYSKGMVARLSFSIGIQKNPDILLIDEVLAVGDVSFKLKCFRHLLNYVKTKERTVIIVSHKIEILKRLCTLGMCIHKGKILKFGEINSVLDEYKSVISTIGDNLHPNQQNSSGLIFKSFDFLAGNGRPVEKLVSEYDYILELKFSIIGELNDVVIVILIYDDSKLIYEINSKNYNLSKSFKTGINTIHMPFRILNSKCNFNWTLKATSIKNDKTYCILNNKLNFKVENKKDIETNLQLSVFEWMYIHESDKFMDDYDWI